MVSARRFGALVVASVIAISLIQLETLPVAAATSSEPKSVATDKLKPLESPESLARNASMPEGDFNDPPTFEQAEPRRV